MKYVLASTVNRLQDVFSERIGLHNSIVLPFSNSSFYAFWIASYQYVPLVRKFDILAERSVENFSDHKGGFMADNVSKRKQREVKILQDWSISNNIINVVKILFSNQ